MKRKILFNICGMSILLAGFVGFPVFASDTIKINIVETVNDGGGIFKPWEDIVGAMPGETYSAIPGVENKGVIPVSVWMCVSGTAINSVGETVSLPANVFGININESWTLDNDGIRSYNESVDGDCYKYNTMLEVDEMTEPLFSEITLSPELGNELQNGTINLYLNAYATDGQEIVPDEPIEPTDATNGGEDTGTINASSSNPSNPDTGSNTTSYFETVRPVFLAAGMVILCAVVAFVVHKFHQKKSK